MKNEAVKFAVVLLLFSGIAGLALGATSLLTRVRIADNDAGVLREALNAVLPQHDNDPFTDKFAWEKYRARLTAAAIFPPAGDIFWTGDIYPARRGGNWNGAALQVVKAGYGGPVVTVIGVDGGGNLVNIRVSSFAQETPGLGTKVTEPAFLDGLQYKERAARVLRSLVNTASFAVNKDGGEIAAVTGATISSRAVVDAVALGMKRLAALQRVLAASAPAARPVAAAPPASAQDATRYGVHR